MGIQTFILISLFFSSYATWVGGAMGLQFLFAHFVQIAIKYKHVSRLPQSLAQMNRNTNRSTKLF